MASYERDVIRAAQQKIQQLAPKIRKLEAQVADEVAAFQASKEEDADTALRWWELQMETAVEKLRSAEQWLEKCKKMVQEKKEKKEPSGAIYKRRKAELIRLKAEEAAAYRSLGISTPTAGVTSGFEELGSNSQNGKVLEPPLRISGSTPYPSKFGAQPPTTFQNSDLDLEPQYSEETPAEEVKKEAEEECDAAPPFVVSWPGATEEQLAERQSEIHCYRMLLEVGIPQAESNLALYGKTPEMRANLIEHLTSLQRQAAEQRAKLMVAPSSPPPVKRKVKFVKKAVASE